MFIARDLVHLIFVIYIYIYIYIYIHNNVQKYGNKALPYSWLLNLEKFAYWYLMTAASFCVAVLSIYIYIYISVKVVGMDGNEMCLNVPLLKSIYITRV